MVLDLSYASFRAFLHDARFCLVGLRLRPLSSKFRRFRRVRGRTPRTLPFGPSGPEKKTVASTGEESLEVGSAWKLNLLRIKEGTRLPIEYPAFDSCRILPIKPRTDALTCPLICPHP